jgi:hypothetical protein
MVQQQKKKFKAQISPEQQQSANAAQQNRDATKALQQK